MFRLTRVRRDDAFANLLLPELLETADLDRRDAGFATALTYGTLRLLGRYDAMIAACTDRPLERIDPAVLDVLRPDLWVKGGDHDPADLPETPLVRSWGGEVVALPYRGVGGTAEVTLPVR